MNKTRIASVVSAVGHPFVMIVLVTLLLSWAMDRAAAWRITGFVAVIGLIPTGWLLWRHFSVRRNHAEPPARSSTRPVLYATMLAVLLISSLYFYWVEHSVVLGRGALVTAMMTAAAAALNRWLKLSLHLAFAVYTGLILVKINPAYGLPILLLVPVLAWARLALMRHTLAEVIGGAALGLVSAMMLIAFWANG